jgi:3-hydroxybutyryl-CoA dehydratase
MNSSSTTPTLGQVITHKRTVTQQDFTTFAELSHDDNPIHVNAAFAATTRFGRTVAHGMFLYGVLCGVLSANFPGARQLEQELVFPKPTYAGDEMTVRLEVLEVWPSSRLARIGTTITRPDGENSCEGQMLVQWREKAA